jgi:hypothetical protein
LAAANLRAESMASRIRAMSGGKFLYAVRVLNELAAGTLPLRGPEDLAQLPAGIEAFYRNTFQRRFPPTEKEAYAPGRSLLAIGTLAAISDLSPAEVEAVLEPIDDLLRRRQLHAAEGGGLDPAPGSILPGAVVV